MAELISKTDSGFIAFLLIVIGAMAALLAVYIRLSQASEALAKKEAKEIQIAKDKIFQDSINVRDIQIAHLIEEGKENTALYQKNISDITSAYQESIKTHDESLRENTRILREITEAFKKALPTIEVIPVMQDQLARMQEDFSDLTKKYNIKE